MGHKLRVQYAESVGAAKQHDTIDRPLHDDFVEEFGRALDEVEVAIGQGIEAAGINDRAHGRSLTSLRPVPTQKADPRGFWTAATCHRFGRWADLSAQQNRVSAARRQ